MNYIHLTHTLIDSFNALADEVQVLTDRKTVLEHKLRYAHEQFQYLADKHAPAAPEISETLAKLQLPPELHPSLQGASSVPLPKRCVGDASHQIALLIRDGRRVAQQLNSIAEPSKTSLSSRETFSRLSNTVTSMSTALEQDFTVEGKKGLLECPFSPPREVADEKEGDKTGNAGVADDPTPHKSSDPICAAMFEEATSQAAATNANKCPIRFLDKHSPEEIAQYVKTHKHDLPRSHTVCVERYQRNEDQIRKLDAKYGNIVSMIESLSHLHKPMLPVSGDGQPEDGVDRDASNQRVESWAQEVSATAGEFPAPAELSARNGDSESRRGDDPDDDGHDQAEQPEREGHFDRPFKEIRVGESPSRPWGISVPVYEFNENGFDTTPPSPPPAPVLMSSPVTNMHNQQTPQKPAGKCPFDHTKLGATAAFGMPSHARDKASEASNKPVTELPFTPQKQAREDERPASPLRPTFLNPTQPAGKPDNGAPQMVFTGPVFIGYPMDQAIQFMQAFQGQR